jgi:hypothetical protein
MLLQLIILLVSYAEDGKANFRELAYEKKDGLVQVGEWFSMMNLLTSKVNGKTLEEQMKNLYRSAACFCVILYAILAYRIPTGSFSFRHSSE